MPLQRPEAKQRTAYTSPIPIESNSNDQKLTPTATAQRGQPSQSSTSELPNAKRRKLGAPASPPKTAHVQHGFHTRFFGDGSGSSTHRAAVVPASALKDPRTRMAAVTTAAIRGNFETVSATGGRAYRDAHFHPTDYKQRGPALTELIGRMKEANIMRTVLMPLPTSYQRVGGMGAKEVAALREGGDLHPNQRYYVPDNWGDEKDFSNTTREEFMAMVATGAMDYDTMVDHTLAKRLEREGPPADPMFQAPDVNGERVRMTQAERDMFDPMLTGLHLGQDKNATDLLRKLGDCPGVFTGIGEITLKKELVDQMFKSDAQADFGDSLKHFKNLVEVAGVVGMPVTVHCDVDEQSNNMKLRSEDGAEVQEHSPAYLDGLKELFSSPELRDTKVIWAHAGGLGRFVQQPKNHTAELAQMLEANPKLHIDISWSRAATQVIADENRQDWVNLIERFPDRFLMGSDSVGGVSVDAWTGTFKTYEPLLQELSPQAREKLLHGNYESVISGSREQVREFERRVLNADFHNQVLTGSDADEITAQVLLQHLPAGWPHHNEQDAG
jgi:Amidohydrolase